MQKIKFLPTVYLIIALLASVLFFTQIQSQKNLIARKALQDVTKVSAKDTPPEPKYVPGEIIVKLKSSLVLKNGNEKGLSPLGDGAYTIDQIDSKSIPETLSRYTSKIRGVNRLARSTKLATKHIRYQESFDRTYLVRLDTNIDITSILLEVNLDHGVEYAEPNYIMEAYTSPNDPYYADAYPDNIPNRDPSWNPPHDYQWNLKKIGVEGAWEITTGSEDIKVAVVDTGVDCTIEEMVGRCAPGYDFINNDDDPMDDFGHGTHVAGTIVSNANNGVGIVGVTWLTKVIPIKSLDNTGSGSMTTISQGIIEAVLRDAKVINLSLGVGPMYAIPTTLQTALDFANDSGVIVVAASGNSGINISQGVWPANYHTVISVGATDERDRRASFSNFGNNLTVVAPGGKGSEEDGDNLYGRNLISLRSFNYGNPVIMGGGASIVGEHYLRARGTSMASPHVAGLAALILTLKKDLSPIEVKNIIANGTDDLGEPGFDQQFGFGRINASTSLRDMDISTPPTSNIVEPLDFLPINPLKTVRFKGVATAKNFANYKVRFATSSNPSSFQLICESTIPVTVPAPLCSWTQDLSDGEYIVRLDVYGVNNILQASSSYRYMVDRTLHYSSPIILKGKTWDSPAVADLDHDGSKEIVVATRSGWISVYKQDGSLFSVWPEKYFDNSLIPEKPLVGNLDNDSELEIVFTVFEQSPNYSGRKIYAYNHNGTSVGGAWPITEPSSSGFEYLTDGLTLADLDGDGIDEIINTSSIVSMSSPPTVKVYIWNKDGTLFSPNWPFLLESAPGEYTHSVPVVADLDGNIINGKEIVIRQTNRLSVVSSQGNLVFSVPMEYSIPFPWSIPQPIIGDIVEDERKEILVTDYIPGMSIQKLRIFRYDGGEVLTPHFPIQSSRWEFAIIYTSPILSNIDGDLRPEIIWGREVYDHDGTLLNTLPTGDLDMFAIFTPVSGEVDGAGATCNQGKEIFAVTNLTTGGSRKLHGWRSDGSIIEHFPKDLSPLMSVQSGVFINDAMSVPLIVDLDNNHKTGIIASIEGLMFSYELGTGCTRTNVDWPESGRSMRKDSSYKTAGRYWKSFTLQGQPGTNIDTAEELLDLLNSRGLKPIEIDRFLNGGWDAHPVNLPFNNFSLTPGSGYLISLDEYPEAKIGPLTRSFVTSVTSLNYSLSPGYTMIGIPTNLLQNINISGAVAEDLCNYIYIQSNQIVSDIGYWDSSAADWNWHTCGGLVNNFTLDGETSLMLKANAYFNFSIPYTRTRSAQNKVNPIQKKSSSKSTEKPKVPSLPR